MKLPFRRPACEAPADGESPGAGQFADLERARLPHEDLAGQDLCCSRLRRADLYAAALSGANLARGDLRRADLRHSRLVGANLLRADLRRADLRYAGAAEACLDKADLRGADLCEADLRGASLALARLAGACLTGCCLAGANLRGADLRNTSLLRADLSGADLRGADLRGVQLGQLYTPSAGANLAGARFDEHTRWSWRVDPTGYGAVLAVGADEVVVLGRGLSRPAAGPRPTEGSLSMVKPRVLFLCTGNSCRSQMAEGWLRHLAGDRFEAFSAGLEPHGLNPNAVAVMAEAGVDIAGHTSDALDRYAGERMDYFITVCDRAAETCPLAPPGSTTLHWSFADPPTVVREQGLSGEAALEVYRRVRDEVRAAIEAFVA